MENMSKTWPNRSFASTWPPKHLLSTSPTGPRPRTSHGHKIDAPAATAARPFTVAAPQMMSLDEEGDNDARKGEADAAHAPGRAPSVPAAAGTGAGGSGRDGAGAVIAADDRFDRLRYWADLTAVHPYFFSRRREGAPPRRV